MVIVHSYVSLPKGTLIMTPFFLSGLTMIKPNLSILIPLTKARYIIHMYIYIYVYDQLSKWNEPPSNPHKVSFLNSSDMGIAKLTNGPRFRTGAPPCSWFFTCINGLETHPS